MHIVRIAGGTMLGLLQVVGFLKPGGTGTTGASVLDRRRGWLGCGLVRRRGEWGWWRIRV